MSWELQVGIDNILYNNDITIYNKPKEELTLPYSTYGTQTIVKHDTKTNDGDDIIFTIDVWAEKKSECSDILEQIYLLLRDNDPIMTSFEVDLKRLDEKEILDDPAGIFHGVFRMRYKLRRL